MSFITSILKAFVGDKKVNQILVQRMRLMTNDAAGRQSVVAVEGENYGLAADLVIKALGFDAEELPTLFNSPALQVTKYGTLDVGKDYMTNLPGVFAAGDIVRGASLVVWAIADGRRVAAGVDAYLRAAPLRAAG